MQDLNILIVEDDPVISLILELRLKKLGFKVSAKASTAQEAIEKLKQEKTDLILMDIMIDGGMDGIDLANYISENYNIPIIFQTGYLDADMISRAKMSNTYGYILKPFSEKELYAAIELGLYRFKQQKINSTEANINSLKKDKKKISIWKGEEMIVISPSDVYYLEVTNGIVTIYTESGKYELRGTLLEWEEKLKDFNFYRCHKCYIVNVDKVCKLICNLDNSYTIQLNDIKADIPLSRQKVKDFNEILLV